MYKNFLLSVYCVQYFWKFSLIFVIFWVLSFIHDVFDMYLFRYIMCLHKLIIDISFTDFCFIFFCLDTCVLEFRYYLYIVWIFLSFLTYLCNIFSLINDVSEMFLFIYIMYLRRLIIDTLVLLFLFCFVSFFIIFYFFYLDTYVWEFRYYMYLIRIFLSFFTYLRNNSE